MSALYQASTGQVTVGVQLGGQTFSLIVMFRTPEAFDRFRRGQIAFAANASANASKAAASGTADYENDVVAKAYSQGGVMIEASIGVQSLTFKPKEAEQGPQIHEHAMTALQRMLETNSSLKKTVDDAYGHAIFPSAARASLVVGVTYGKGEVFEKGTVIGYAGVIQITAGVQVGGETMHVLVLMNDGQALERFKSGKVSFAASTSVAMIKAGAIAGKNPNGLRVIMFVEGGEMLEAAIGAQTFKFVPAAIGRMRQAG